MNLCIYNSGVYTSFSQAVSTPGTASAHVFNTRAYVHAYFKYTLLALYGNAQKEVIHVCGIEVSI